jgi:CheY-like chemotaxis protein
MSNKPKRILLLDDDYESMHDLKTYLEEELGWEVEFSAEKNLLQRLGRERFDLLLVDLMIRPKILGDDGQEIQNIHYDNVKWNRTGLEFIRRFREGEYSQEGKGTSRNVPLIALSAVADSTAEGEWGKIIQNEHHVEKPFRLLELIELMRKLVQE